MNRVCVAQTSLVCGLGDNLDQTWRRLLAGESAIAPVTRFAVDRFNAHQAACIQGLQSQAERSLTDALLERLIQGLEPVPAESRLFLATTKGSIDSLERLRRGLGGSSEEMEFRRLLARVARGFGLKDGGVNINAACASSTIALARAAALIASGTVESAVVCCLDLVSEFVFSGFSVLQGLSREPSRPFDRDRSGLSLGEGAAVLVLTSEQRLRREGRACLGTLQGWGVANDAHHITAPSRDGCGLVQAVRRALQVAGITAEDLAAINAHGTGTVYNDLMELTAFRTLFGDDHRLPVHSVKGAIGHTLGAAGGIEAVLGLRSLAEGIIPPTVGLRHPEPAAEGLVSDRPQPITGSMLLSTNSGFGGINAALVLGRGDSQ